MSKSKEKSKERPLNAKLVTEVGAPFKSALDNLNGLVPIKTEDGDVYREAPGTSVDVGDYRVVVDGRVYFVDGPVFEAIFAEVAKS